MKYELINHLKLSLHLIDNPYIFMITTNTSRESAESKTEMFSMQYAI